MPILFEIARYVLREGSGGKGRQRGGDGLVRQYQFLQPADITLLSDRRVIQPFGLEGGEPGQLGRNRLEQNGVENDIPGKCSLPVKKDDVLTIETPGGGGYRIP